MLRLLYYNDDEYPYIGNGLLFFFCGYIIILFLQIGDRFPALGAIRFELIYASILALFALLFTPKVQLDCPVIWVALLLMLAMIFQVPFSQNVSLSWDVFIDRVVKFSFIALFIASFVKSPKHLIFFMGAFLLACMKLGQEGLVGRITGSMVWENQGVMRLHGPTSIYTHPNSFAGMALGVLPFVISFYPISSKIIKILLIVLGLLSLNIIIFTGSRTGYVAFIALILYVLYQSKNFKVVMIGLFAFLVCIPLIPEQYVNRFETIFTGQDIEGRSIEKRKEIISDAIEIFKKNPLGVGLGAFTTVRRKMFDRFQDTHNLYLEVATNLGIQGLIIFLIFLYKMYRTLKYLKNKTINDKFKLLDIIKDKVIEAEEKNDIDRHIKDLSLIEASIGAVLLYLYIRVVLGLFGHDLYEIYWWFSLGITISIYNLYRYAQRKTEIFTTRYQNVKGE